MEKLEAVQKVLRFSTAIREWCTMEFSIYFDDFDEQNVDDYNSGGYGEVADEILERGLDEKIIEEDDVAYQTQREYMQASKFLSRSDLPPGKLQL